MNLLNIKMYMMYRLPTLLTAIVIALTTLECTAAVPVVSPLCPQTTQRCRTSLRHIEGGGIGYNHGYTTLEGFFAPDVAQNKLMPFLDLRGHVFNNGKIAVNAGVGLRKMRGHRIYGLNTYYDYRNTDKIHYNQIGFGLETLGKRFDFLFNGYVPVGRTITHPYNTQSTGFAGHNLMLSQKYQFAMAGANAEFGYHFEKSVGRKLRPFDFYVGAGPYYFNAKIGHNAWGGKGRVTCAFNEYVKIEVSNSYDTVFHNKFQCELTLTLPFGGSSAAHDTVAHSSCDTYNALSSRLVQPVIRQEIIVVDQRRKCAPAIDPTTGKPFNFVFVDNTSHSLGTYESPYPTLVLAQDNSTIGDIIYVFPGDGTTQGMNAGITLQQNQKFWGSGLDYTLQTAQGTIIIPAQTTTAPKMTNVAGDGITLAAANQVKGFILTDVAGNGIIGTAAETIEIAECTIDNSSSDQIHLEYHGTSGIATLDKLTLTNGQLNALFIDATAPSMACTISNGIMQDNANNALESSFAQQATMNFTNNLVERNAGTSLFSFNGPAALVVSGNIFNTNSSIDLAPMTITAGSSPLAATIANNNITNNICSGIHCILNNTDAAQLSIKNNRITNNGTGAIGPFGASLFIDPNGTTQGNCTVLLTGNTILDNDGSSLYCFNGAFNDFKVNAFGNTLTNNGGGGFVFANACNAFSLTAQNNSITNGADHGITTAGGITMGTATLTITDNQITGNTNFANGIALSHEGTDLTFNISTNDLSNNATSGVLLFSSGIIENVTFNMANNDVIDNQNAGSNQAGGIDLEQFTNLLGSITDTVLFGNTSPGIFIGSTDPSSAVCLALSGNTNDNGYTFSNNNIFNLAPCNVDTVNFGLITAPLNPLTLVQSCPDAAPCPP
jgi:hypothetical protein